MSGVYFFLVLIFSAYAYAADRLMDCEPQRITGDKRYWSYRIIDGRTCWYPGRPGKPKTELHWPAEAPESDHRNRASEAEQPGRPSQIPESSEAAPAIEKTQDRLSQGELKWQATPEDQLKAFTCCWPEPEQQSSTPSTTLTLPKATPPTQPIWPLIFLPIIVIAGAVLLAKRSLT